MDISIDLMDDCVSETPPKWVGSMGEHAGTACKNRPKETLFEPVKGVVGLAIRDNRPVCLHLFQTYKQYFAKERSVVCRFVAWLLCTALFARRTHTFECRLSNRILSCALITLAYWWRWSVVMLGRAQPDASLSHPACSFGGGQVRLDPVAKWLKRLGPVF